MLLGLSIIILSGTFGRHTLIFSHIRLDVFTVQRALPWPPNKAFFVFLTNSQRTTGCANLIESCAFSQSSHGCNCKLNAVAWLVEVTYGNVVFICEELVRWPWEGAFHCNGTHTNSDRVG